MNKPLTIAFIGAHGSGKTTLIERIKATLYYITPFIVTREVARECPFDVGITSNSNTQVWIMHTQDELEHIALGLGLPVLLDRCLLDQYAYYRYWGGRDDGLEKIVRNACERYDAIYLLEARPDFLVDDGLRPTDIHFQIDIEHLIRENLSLFGIEYVDVARNFNSVHEICVERITKCQNSITPTPQEMMQSLNLIIEPISRMLELINHGC